MAGKLTDKFMDQLEQWIGTGPKKFDLLYAITRDGCSNTTFHQICDNQGSTVTVLYNQQGSIYGGYTAASWDQSNQYKNDATAFLFRLQYNNGPSANNFQCKNPQYAIYCTVGCGPIFGGGHDLVSFSGTINNSGGYFALNGNMNNLSHSYNNHGVVANQINNGTMDVAELEVYRVTDGKRVSKPPTLSKPWRTTPEWSTESLECLQNDVIQCTPPKFAQIPYYKILLLGPVGAGKSSFFNTIASVFRGRIVVQAPCGSVEHSLTAKYRIYPVCFSKTGQPLNFRLCDTRGLEDGQGMDGNDVSYLLDGNLPDGFQFNPSVPISPETPSFKKSTTLKDKIHCVCLVIDGSTGGVLPEKMLEKIKSIQTKIHVRGIPQMVLLTKVDKICPDVSKDITQVFKDGNAVEEQVNKISQLLGVPPNQVLPMKNYMTEVELSDNVSILALLTLRQILNACEDFMQNFFEETNYRSDEASGLTPD